LIKNGIKQLVKNHDILRAERGAVLSIFLAVRYFRMPIIFRNSVTYERTQIASCYMGFKTTIIGHYAGNYLQLYSELQLTLTILTYFY
jgi:hypothetical protein